MKKNILSFNIIILILSLVFSSNLASQTKPDIELTKDEAVLRIAEFEAKVKEDSSKLSNQTKDFEKAKEELASLNKQIKECSEAQYSLIGATPAEVEKFKQQLGIIEGKVRNKQKLSPEQIVEQMEDVLALETELNKLRGIKISILPEFFDKIISVAKDINSLKNSENIVKSKVKTYTVGTWEKDKDCLWNIAGKIEIYGDPFMWPKIWQSNTDLIKNPDIIKTGQVLKLPPPAVKTSDEIKAERKYFRNKRAAEEKPATVQPAEKKSK